MRAIERPPIRSDQAVARDARGAAIGRDRFLSRGYPVNNINGVNWAGPSVLTTLPATITPTLIGVALPRAIHWRRKSGDINPSIALLPADSVLAGVTAVTVSTAVLDSLGNPAVGRLVRFDALLGTIPDPVQVDGSGFATVVWTPPNTAGRYTLTGVLGPPSLFTLADSTGRIVIRRSVTVYADVPNALLSTVVASQTSVANTTGTAVITITARDQFGNISKGAKPADFTLASSAGGGTFSALLLVWHLYGDLHAPATRPGHYGHITVP